jgi:hypothetical protein
MNIQTSPKVAHADHRQWQRFASHRIGSLRNKRLLSGVEGAPDNYELSIVENGPDYATPAHRHNFDQIRYQLEGSFAFGEGRVQEEGSLGYFAEGTAYAQQGLEHGRTLLLQFGGNSGTGFLSYQQLEQGQAKLMEAGRFEGGLYHSSDGGDGKDAYEAIWERMNGRPLEYPQPRFLEPVVVNPEGFEWTDVEGEPGVRERVCGRFGERRIGMGFLALDAGANHRTLDGRLYFALAGRGTVADQEWWPESAIDPGEAAGSLIEASESAHFIIFDRPRF